MPKPPRRVALSKKEIGERLRKLRQESGITQVRLAKILGTQQTAISQVELGNRGLHQVVRLAKALGVPTDSILAQPSSTSRDGFPRDRGLLLRVRRIERLPRTEKQALLKAIDAFLNGSQVA